MASKPIQDAASSVEEKAQEARDKAAELQAGAAERVNEIRSQVGDTAREAAIDGQAKAQWQATRALRQAERTPDTVYLMAVFVSMALSMVLLMKKRRSMSLFIGLWPVTILNLAMLLKNRRPSQEVTRFPSVVDVKDELLAE